MIATRPFVDRPVSDRDVVVEIAHRQATEWNLPDPTLLRHGMNSLFECGDTVIRIGAATAPARLAHELAHWLIDSGVPTIMPIDGLTADIDALAVTVWERVASVRVGVDWREVGRAVRTVHSLSIDDVPDGYPLPDPSNFPWWDFDAMLADVDGEVDAAALEGIVECLDGSAGWREMVARDAVLCHGDVHPGNVLVSQRGSLLIDWDLMCVANAAWDHAMLTTLAERWGGDPAVHAAFVDGYGAPSVDPDVATALGQLRNVAATLMRVKAGRADPAAADEAARRLKYWRGDPDAPKWLAQ